jgi:hypothetical protein
MAEHRLIQQYTDVLLAQLPDRLAVEVADGLADAYAAHVREGLSADEAARATVAEFGDAQDVVDGFTSSSPSRRIARKLVVAGPAVGACWASALIAGHAWNWSVPLLARVLVGATLIAIVVVLARAALGSGYRAVHRAGIAGCLGLAILDATAIALVLAAAPNVGWLVVLAALASTTRLTCVAGALRSVLA